MLTLTTLPESFETTSKFLTTGLPAPEIVTVKYGLVVAPAAVNATFQTFVPVPVSVVVKLETLPEPDVV